MVLPLECKRRCAGCCIQSRQQSWAVSLGTAAANIYFVALADIISGKTVVGLTFQALIGTLQAYWGQQGCVLVQPADCPMGAGTFHPATFLKALGPAPWSAAYVQPCRRPADGRYGDNPNRAQYYYQFQVVLKPTPDDFQAQYLGSLTALGIDLAQHDVRFVEDNWASPTLAAWGLGWEVWLDGMEVTQFTYFQQVGGVACCPIMGEITYGLERIAMYLQGVDSLYDIVWADGPDGQIMYGELWRPYEQQMSAYYFEQADVAELWRTLAAAEAQCQTLLAQALVLPAYECVLQASHAFNVLDARRAVSVAERQATLLRVRRLAEAVAKAYLAEDNADKAASVAQEITHG